MFPGVDGIDRRIRHFDNGLIAVGNGGVVTLFHQLAPPGNCLKHGKLGVGELRSRCQPSIEHDSKTEVLVNKAGEREKPVLRGRPPALIHVTPIRRRKFRPSTRPNAFNERVEELPCRMPGRQLEQWRIAPADVAFESVCHGSHSY